MEIRLLYGIQYLMLTSDEYMFVPYLDRIGQLVYTTNKELTSVVMTYNGN
jgi:hypothetical protein